ASQRDNGVQADKKETKSKAELLDAVKELAEMERALAQLKALKDRDKQIYSVVPYRGKRGDMRPPIYIECVTDGLLFHPEKKLLGRWEFNPAAIRAEVENRAGPLVIQKTAKEDAKQPRESMKRPYVLFLVRPNGIDSYYKGQAALRAFDLDFGYELVDEGWVLDFSNATYAKNGPPSEPANRLNPSGSQPIFPGNAGTQGSGGSLAGN